MDSSNRSLQFFAAFLAVLLVGACLCLAGFGLGYLTGVVTTDEADQAAVAAQVDLPEEDSALLAPDATAEPPSAPEDSTSVEPPATDGESQTVVVDNFDIFWEALDLLDENFDGEVPQGAEVTAGAVEGLELAAEGCEERSDLPVTPGVVEVSDDAPRNAPDDFDAFWKAANEVYARCDPTAFPPTDLPFAAFAGVVARTEDNYTELLPPTRAESFRIELDSSFEGIGASVNDAEGGGILIVRPFPDSPAEAAGLLVDDVITAVDGKDVTSLSLDEAIRLIRGPKDSKVMLTIRREGEPEPFDVEVVRDRINIPVLQTETLENGVVRVSLLDFSGRAEDELREALQKAVDNKTKAVILDLRGNPGGRLDVSIDIASMFIEDGVIVSESGQRNEDHEATGKAIIPDLPLVVLVDGGSASASEIVAGAIQDYERGPLVGETTYGKGSVQSLFDLSDGSMLRVTTSRWFTPDGRQIQDEGLIPDIEVLFDREAGEDNQLQAAIDYLLEKLQQ